MTDTSEVARQKALKRWGNQRPIKLARELRPRADELPADVRQQLREALDNLGGDAA
jgi:hypothetical protein